MNTEIFEKLKGVVNFLWEHQNPFYREKWQKAGFSPDKLKTPADFALVPFLTRKEIVEGQLWDPLPILYGPPTDIAYVRTTGMTTSAELSRAFEDQHEYPLLFSLQSNREYNRQDKLYALIENRPSRLLVIEHARRIITNFFHTKCWLAGEGFPVVGDILNLNFTAHIAKKARVDGIMCGSASALLGLIPHFKTISFSPDSVKFVFVDVVTRTELQAIRAFFRKALIFTGMGLSEFDGGVSIMCRELASGDFSSAVFHHPKARVYAEIVDPETGSLLSYGETGELILSHLDTKSPFPVIRYRTGDKGLLMPAPCGCGLKDNQAFYLGYRGRLAPNVIRASGTIFSITGFAQAISNMHDLVHEKFEARISQKRSGWHVTTHIDLRVQRRNADIAPDMIGARFEQIFKISPRFTLEDAIRTGAFSKPTVALLPDSASPQLPQSRLIDGLEY